jgi:acyl dehydratase
LAAIDNVALITHPMRYLEDLTAGESGVYGPHLVTEQEILAFARQWDPQWFHADPVAARESTYGGLIASGVHTLAVMSRLLVGGWAGAIANLGSPGLDEIALPHPVRPGDALRLHLTVDGLRASASRPDRGIVHVALIVINQDDRDVLRTGTTLLVRRRPARREGAGEGPEGR